MNLTQKDTELAKRYIVLRGAIKGFTRDKQKITDSQFELGRSYVKVIEDALVKANDELKELRKYPLEIKVTDQPTVYEVKIGNRIGFIEINIVEITEEVSKLLAN